MSGSKPLYYWDSNVFLLLCKEENTIPDALIGAKNIANMLDKGEARLVTSEIVRLEFLEATTGKAQKIFNEILLRGNTEVQSVNRKVIDLALEIRRFYKAHKEEKRRPQLHFPKASDAIHLATAALHQAQEFHTSESKLINLSETFEEKFGVTICMPPTPSQTNLFDVVRESDAPTYDSPDESESPSEFDSEPDLAVSQEVQ